MNLNHLNYFRVLAKVEHYTQAASILSITQPSLSHAISNLESELGTYLFEKQGRNVKLTKSGKLFLKYVDESLNILEIGEKKLKDFLDPSKGKIDLAFIYTLGAEFIPNTINEFLNDSSNKNITFTFGQDNTTNIINGLKSEKYDLAFCSFVENEPNIEFFPVIKQDLVLIISKDHPLSCKDNIDLKETEDYPFVYFNKESGIRPIIDNLFSQAQITPKIICEVEEDTAVAGLVSINYGIAILPNISILKNFNVKIIPISNLNYERYIYMASLKNRYSTPSVKSFFKFITDKYNKVWYNNIFFQHFKVINRFDPLSIV